MLSVHPVQQFKQGFLAAKGVIQPYATKGQNKALLSPASGQWAVGQIFWPAMSEDLHAAT